MIQVKLSHDLFWGFSIEVPESLLVEPLNIQSAFINNEAKVQLKNIFEKMNLRILMEKADSLKVHLHEELKANVTNYACDHCH